MFESIVPIGIKLIDVIYECTRCGEHRPYGRETTDGKIAKDDDDGDTDDRTAA